MSIKTRRSLMTVAFVLYCLLVLYLGLFMRKSAGVIFSCNVPLEWAKAHTSLIPFVSIRSYGTQMFTSNWHWAFLNFFGNLVCFMPFALFVPYFFPKTRTRGWFFTAMLIIISIIEIGQFVFMCGAFDIDDYILIMMGTWIVYEPINQVNKNKEYIYSLLGAKSNR